MQPGVGREVSRRRVALSADGPALEEVGRSESMTRAECLEHLSRAQVGRLGVSIGALPVIRPIDYSLVDDAVLLRLPDQRALVQASNGRVVAFEVDGFDPSSGAYWYVLVQGIPAEIEPDKLAGLGPLWALPNLADHRPTRALLLALDVVSGGRCAASSVR
jgi:uncharacterized protein